MVEEDGWRLVRMTGSHQHYRHSEKPGIVTIPEHPGEDLKPGTWASIQRQAGIRKEQR